MILLFSVYWILYQNLPNSNNWRELQVYVNSTISTSLSLHNTYKNVQAFYDFHNSNSCSQKVQMYFLLLHQNGLHPMDTSLLIRHRFDVEIPRGKFAEITSILKGESTWKLWHRFDVDISTWIRLSKSTKYRWVLHVDFSMSFRRQIDVTSVLAVSILSFSNICCSGNLF